MGNFYMESTQINYRRDEKLKTVDQKLQELSETSAIDTDIAPVFKSTNTYQPGDMVYYRNKLYVFNVEHTGAWAAADVTATDVTTEISSLKSGLIDVNSNITSLQYGTIVEVGTDAELASLLYNKKNYKKSFLLKDSTKTMTLLNKYDTTYAYVTFYSGEHIWNNHPDYIGNFSANIICGAVEVTSTAINLLQTYKAVTENVT